MLKSKILVYCGYYDRPTEYTDYFEIRVMFYLDAEQHVIRSRFTVSNSGYAACLTFKEL